MKTADLTGAMLDYYVARAEGVPVAELEIRAIGTLCVRNFPVAGMRVPMTLVLDYSTNWALTGPLLEKHFVEVFCNRAPLVWSGFITKYKPHIHTFQESGPTPLIAICRALVRAAFGNEVDDLLL